jgi:hypothetical protein
MIIKFDNITLTNVKKVLRILSFAGLIGCLLVFIPQVRDVIIKFGEDFIVHRALIAPVWHGRMERWALIGVFFIFWFLSILYLPKNIQPLGYIFLCIFYFGSFIFLTITLNIGRVDYDKRIYELEQFTKYVEHGDTIGIFGSFYENGDFYRTQYAFSPHEIIVNDTDVNYLIGYMPQETIPGWHVISVMENFVLYGRNNK